MKAAAGRILFDAAALILSIWICRPAVAEGLALDIPCQKFILPNGLTLVVHEDHKVPLVAVSVLYHVGSKNEPPGRTGFAHLFEHLMFKGSEHYNKEYNGALEPLGATDLNGTTDEDETLYIQTVPTSALDVVLFMESDRMGYLANVIDQARLDEVRGVVENEKRLAQDSPYGQVWDSIASNSYPANHPYAHRSIGSMEDLNAASLGDVRNWFHQYYGAANVVVSIAGDVDTKTVKAKVERYFGEIPAGPPLTRQSSSVARMQGAHRMTMRDRVPLPRIYKVWNVPERTDPESVLLDLASDGLVLGKTGRLYERLVYRDKVATDVEAGLVQREIGSQFYVAVTAAPGVDLGTIEKSVDDEMARFFSQGPTEQELARVKAQFFATFARNSERVGGWRGQSVMLAEAEVYGGSPESYKAVLSRVEEATREKIRHAATEWLGGGVLTVEVQPFPAYQTSAAIDRSSLPEPARLPEPSFPAVQDFTLGNGLRVKLAERHSVPIVNFDLVVDAGYAVNDSLHFGLASLTMAMLDQGTTTRKALDISHDLADLGVTLKRRTDLDTNTISLSASRSTLEPCLQLLADVVLNPTFDEGELVRVRAERLAALEKDKLTPFLAALRVLPSALYGKGHPYAQPHRGVGTAASLGGLTAAELRTFHRTWFQPGNATLVVAGDITAGELRVILEKTFGVWRGTGRWPKKDLPVRDRPPGNVVYLIDRPEAPQTQILAATLGPPRANPDEDALQLANAVLGGALESRLFANLRTDKHWSYGANSFFWDARGQRPFIVSTPVQTDKSAQAMREIVAEIRGLNGQKPITPAELAAAIKSQILSFPGLWETSEAVSASLAEIVRYNLPEDYYNGYAAKREAVTLDEVRAAAKNLIDPDHLVWVVVGDRAKIESDVRGLRLGEVKTVDADGNPVP
ncbi:MAG: insulinase family protein [Acidobacteriota bacterium]|nr:insulinase family protein [Acidobacteriota bacterium]